MFIIYIELAAVVFSVYLLINPVSAKELNLAILTPYEEVEPTNSTAEGVLFFGAHYDGPKYHVILKDINSAVRMINLHQGSPGKNGPLVAILYESDQEFKQNCIRSHGWSNCFVVTGNFSNSNLHGSLKGKDFTSLIELIQPDRGGLYVNVTTENIPSGEIRGQLEETGLYAIDYIP